MILEDDQPRPTRATFIPPLLDSWGVADLRDYIVTLQAEIARAEGAIAKREAHRGAADAFFKLPKD